MLKFWQIVILAFALLVLAVALAQTLHEITGALR